MLQPTIDPEVGQPKIEPNHADPRTLNFSNYIDSATLNTVPLQHDWTLKVRKPWRRMGNWTLSDCTCAAAGHMIECWTANTTHEDVITTDEVVTGFSALTGYDATTGKNDVGVNYLDALNYWRNTGFAGHKIKLYTLVDHASHDLVRAAVYLFGGAYLGLDLPNTIKKKDIWEVMPGGLTGDRAVGSFGGHAVNIVAYDETYITCISWGKVKKLTWEFFDTYCYALYAVVTDDFFKDGKNALGLDLTMLETDLLAIAKQKEELQHELEEMESRSGRTGGASGTRAGSGGGAVGASGTKAGQNGGLASTSGGKGGASGGSAGSAGGAAGGSGRSAGASGGSAGSAGGSVG